MSLRIITRVETGLGTVSKTIEADTAEDWKMLQDVFQRACNLWPDAPPSIKKLADMIIEGKVLQDYDAQDTSAASKITCSGCQKSIAAHYFKYHQCPVLQNALDKLQKD
jgi:hypothetical protein